MNQFDQTLKTWNNKSIDVCIIDYTQLTNKNYIIWVLVGVHQELLTNKKKLLVKGNTCTKNHHNITDMILEVSTGMIRVGWVEAFSYPYPLQI